MIRRVRIRGYKSIADLDLELRPLTVLFGPNAAGKSNFLDALQLLSRVVVSRTLKEAFEPPYRGTALESFAFSERGLAGHLEAERLEFQLEADIELSPRTVASVERQIAEMRRPGSPDLGGDESGGNGTGSPEGGSARKWVRETLLRYRVCVEILPGSGFLRVADEHLAALRADGQEKTSRKPFIDRQGRRLRLRLEGQAHPTDHDLGLDHTLVSRPLYAPHYPHITALREELREWAFFYFEPRERMRALNPVKEVRHIGMMGEELAAFLNTLRVTNPAQLRAVEKALRMLVPQVDGIRVSPSSLGEVELRLLEGGVEMPARLVSEGTLRMLGLLAIASSTQPATLIAFEEPENGIHPRRIRLLAELLRARSNAQGAQLIVTTHSPILPDLLPDEALFPCFRAGRATRICSLQDRLGPIGLKPLFRADRIRDELDFDEPRTKISERILRGDFDA